MPRNPWIPLGYNLFSLGLEMSSVIALRSTQIALGGPGAEKESTRMVSEKLQALADLQMMFLTGQMGSSAPAALTKTVSHYRRKVRANRKRLSKS